MTAPQLVLLAGPNGAGKSTFYQLFLADSPLPLLDPDALADELDVPAADAARIADATRARMIEDGLGFITETVFSDPVGAKLAMLRAALAAGYDVRLIYIGLASAALGGARIDQRVATGGHDVPRDKLAPRFERSLANLRAAIAFVPWVELYDNSSPTEPYRLVARFERGTLVERGRGRVPAWARSLVPARRSA